jgi:hypothetical protein
MMAKSWNDRQRQISKGTANLTNASETQTSSGSRLSTLEGLKLVFTQYLMETKQNEQINKNTVAQVRPGAVLPVAAAGVAAIANRASLAAYVETWWQGGP